MKLVIVLFIIAYGYAEKLDRAYLPPVNAARAGGSPGALSAPGVSASAQPGSSSGQAGSAFGQGLPSAGQLGSGLSRPTYGGVSGSSQNEPVFGSGINQGPGGINQGSSSINQYQSGSGSNTLAPGGRGKTTLLGANAPFGTSQGTFGSTPVAGSFNVGAQQTYKVQGGEFSNQGFGQGVQGFNVPQAQPYKPDRLQAAADRNAEILKYVNENNGESYLYSYETSNGISAEESGVATNGVKAQGGFSYTDDDGQAYSLTYTADENGFQPQGEHLPTPHPIPEEILKSIEENARAAAAGSQEGAYRPEEYESEGSPQQYNVGQTSYDRPQGQSQGPIKGSFSQGPQSNQFSVNQGTYGTTGQSGQTGRTKPNQGSNQFATRPNGLQGPISQYQQGSGSNQGRDNQFGQSGQIGQVKPSQGLSQFATGQAGPQVQNGQYQNGLGSSQGSFAQSTGQGSIAQGLGRTSQIQDSSGYNYNQPQNAFGSDTQFGSSGSGKNRPQANQSQVTTTFGSQNAQGSFGLQSSKLSPSETSFGNSQFGFGQSQKLNRPGNQPTGSAGSFGQGQNQLNANKRFGSSQGSQFRPGTQGSSGPTISGSSGYQYEVNANRPTFGNKPTGISSQPTQGSQYQPSANQPSFGANNGIKGSTQFGSRNTGPNGQSGQAQQNGNRPFGGSTVNNQGSSPFGGSSGIQNPGTGSLFGQANKPSFGSNVGPNQGSPQFGLGSQQSSSAQGLSGPKDSLPVQAPYQYDKPSQSFPTQQRLGSTGFSGNNGPSSGSQGINTQRPGVTSFGPQGETGRPGDNSPGSQGLIGQSSGYTGSQGGNERPGYTGSQSVNGRPAGSSPGSQGLIGQSSGYTGSQGGNERPGYTGYQSVNGRPAGSSPGSQGVVGQSPGYTGSQGANGRPDYTEISGVSGQRPGSTTSGSQGVNGQRPISPRISGSSQGNQGRPDQFGGPRQPPSFSPQEGYKY